MIVRYSYEMAAYNAVTLYVNGVYVDSEVFMKSGHDWFNSEQVDADKGTLVWQEYEWAHIDWFRMFNCYASAVNCGWDVDSIELVANYNSEGLYQETTEFVGYQLTAPDTDGYFNLRLISLLNDDNLEKYNAVGYQVTVTYKVGDQSYSETLPANLARCNSVFTSVQATTAMGGLETITAKDLGGKYIFALNVCDISENWTEIQFTVSTFYQLKDSDTPVYQGETVFTVDPTTANQGGMN